MRKLLTIAFTMFSLAGCLDEAPAPNTNEKAFPADQLETVGEAPATARIPGDEDLANPPEGIVRCVVSDDCVLADPNTEYRMCDRESGTCIRNPLPF